VDIFLAPAALLLIAAGVLPVLAWCGRRARLAVAALAALLLFPVAQAGYRIAVPWVRLDAATPTAFVLRQRQPHEPVVGLLWEHRYYFRGLGPLYRPLRISPTDPPGLPPTSLEGLPGEEAMTRLWLVGERQEAVQQVYLTELPPAGAWHVTAKYDFKDSTALYLEREEAVPHGPQTE
jgi:hypothetical protein